MTRVLAGFFVTGGDSTTAWQDMLRLIGTEFKFLYAGDVNSVLTKNFDDFLANVGKVPSASLLCLYPTRDGCSKSVR